MLYLAYRLHTEAETMEERGLLTCSQAHLLPHIDQAQDGTTHRGPGHLHQSALRKRLPQMCTAANPMEAILQSKLLLPRHV